MPAGAAATNPKVYAKLLVSNAAAGSIIGKVRGAGWGSYSAVLHVVDSRGEDRLGGSWYRGWQTARTQRECATRRHAAVLLAYENSPAGVLGVQGGGNINDFQQKTFAKIQLSKASEYFPGTVERILMLTGRLKQVKAEQRVEERGMMGRSVCHVVCQGAEALPARQLQAAPAPALHPCRRARCYARAGTCSGAAPWVASPGQQGKAPSCSCSARSRANPPSLPPPPANLKTGYTGF